MCADEVPAEERESFRAFSELLASLLHQEFRTRLETLKDTYHPFNPDTDARTIVELSAAERQAAQVRLVDELTALAEDANFERISADDLGRAFVEESLMKVRLEADFDDFEQVVFYRRGVRTRQEEVKHLFGLRRRTIEFTNYAKVLVYVKFKDADHFEAQGKDVDVLPFTPGSTIIKLFQDVPRADLEMLFPNARVRMRLVDKLLIGVPAVISGVVVVVTKLIASLIPVLLLLGFWLGVRREPVELNQAQLVALGAALAAFGGFLVRQYTKFKNRKIQFMKALSENLYFRNLDNDAGVFHHLLDAAEEEEVKEAVLAYHFLRSAERPLTAAELDRADRGLVRPAVGCRVRLRGRRRCGQVAPAAADRRRRAGAVDRGAAGRRQTPPGPDLGRLVRLQLVACGGGVAPSPADRDFGLRERGRLRL